MSALTITKLKKLVYVGNTSTPGILGIGGCCRSPQVNESITPTESSRISYEMIKCGVTVVNGVSVPISGKPAPISPKNTPASITTTRAVEAVILAAISPTDPATRFSNFFPTPIPPPQNLQPGYIRYNFNANAPKYTVPPCIGFRYVR